tara:strand:+ start:250 stop:648 length:399 start_codon:yes stop_codon:yes gene_type:complete
MMKLDMGNVDVNAMGEQELRALCTQLLEERGQVSDLMVDLYHPEMGSEWMDDGEIGQAILSARASALDEAMALIVPPEGAHGDGAVALSIAVRALTAKRGALIDRANEAARARKLRRSAITFAAAKERAEAN